MEVFIVTGAASGIGKAVCDALNMKGQKFIAVDKNVQRLQELYSENYFSCDLTDSDKIKSMFESIRHDNFILKGLIHCAGICLVQNLAEIKSKDMDLTYKVNVFSFIEMYQQFTMCNIAKDARIIALSSITAKRAYKNQLLYASSKAALESVCKSLAQDGVTKDIKVNIVELGAVKTEMFDSLSPNMETIGRHYPLGLLEPSEAAEIICNLTSVVYHRTTGGIITIDSGFNVVH